MKKYPIYHLRFPSQYLMTSTLMRLEEFYESPRFGGQVFTHEEYMDWYAHTNGSMSYFTDWGGFNIPSRVIEQFSALFHPLSEKEKRLINLLRRNVQGVYYLVATCNNDQATLAHEVVHGLFSLSAVYSMDVKLILSEYDMEPYFRILRGMGYADAVLGDELNAYAVTGLPDELIKSKKKLVRVQDKLLKLVEKHFGVKLSQKGGRKKLLECIHTLDWGVGDAIRCP